MIFEKSDSTAILPLPFPFVESPPSFPFSIAFLVSLLGVCSDSEVPLSLLTLEGFR